MSIFQRKFDSLSKTKRKDEKFEVVSGGLGNFIGGNTFKNVFYGAPQELQVILAQVLTFLIVATLFYFLKLRKFFHKIMQI